MDEVKQVPYCNWDLTSEVNRRYHDEEWGVPLHDDYKQFEFLMMEVMQCGLNWDMMMKKREIFRACFAQFDYDKVAKFTDEDVERIMQMPGMIRSSHKIRAVIRNARAFQQIRAEFGSFSAYLWDYSDNKTILYQRHAEGYIPVSNGLSAKISKDLKKRGFSFLGPVTVYSHLQACGIINDHDKNCPRYRELVAKYPTVAKRRYLEKDVSFYGDA